uniref:Uncharacterized protein n=1 Tax=Amphiprion percula TaxID=161767 RepID=A0A3P8TVI6_AMPPE
PRSRRPYGNRTLTSERVQSFVCHFTNASGPHLFAWACEQAGTQRVEASPRDGVSDTSRPGFDLDASEHYATPLSSEAEKDSVRHILNVDTNEICSGLLARREPSTLSRMKMSNAYMIATHPGKRNVRGAIMSMVRGSRHTD